MTDDFKCACCKQTFTKTWSDKEALKSSEKEFGQIEKWLDDVEVVCDDCYRHIMAANKEKM
ncbi:hypothetical protein LCGC14_1209730 [marine sediment metagenome]|uniref:Uncharacterized protein n=1 Tax=marine sediment metagenome TaxID=412755 RepID=A0A0F9LIP7_9ZZZZ